MQRIALVLLLILPCLTACEKTARPESESGTSVRGSAGQPLSVFVSILPQADFVQRIGGARG